LLDEYNNEHIYLKAFLNQNMLEPALSCLANMIRVTGQWLLQKINVKGSDELLQLSNQIGYFVSAAPNVTEPLHQLVSTLDSINAESKQDIESFSLTVLRWHDSVLNFARKTNSPHFSEQPSSYELIDLSEDEIPMNYLRSRRALAKLNSGELLRIRLKNVSTSTLIEKGLKQIGYIVLLSEKERGRSSIILSVLKPHEDVGQNIRPQLAMS